ncbi:hypothetical protein A4S06_11125 [Erysipelotrichaceae bacterium MTC7]|nr:hypothetical protein A4S06_11125 [Erysipelotrichaceae bacterium MTC7]
MKNFTYYVPTKIHFGKNQIQHLPEEVASFGKRVLLVYGAGSIKTLGLYDEVYRLLDDCTIVECSGIEPNPRIDSVRKGVKLCKTHNIDVILAVGGGSVLDASKGIAAGALSKEDPWELTLDAKKIKVALPILSVLTLSATGSEMDQTAVITNPETKSKRGFASDLLFPKVSICDPTYTYTVSAFQSAAGVADIMSHIMETFFHHEEGCDISDQVAIDLLKTCVKYGPVLLDEPDNYEARANIMWAGTWAINGFLVAGPGKKWSCHAMQHILSAYYDVTHGATLALLEPAWLAYILNDTNKDRIARFAREVFHVEEENTRACATLGIQKLYAFFTETMKLPKNFEELGIPTDANLEALAKECVKVRPGGHIDGYEVLEANDVYEIYKRCM